MGKLRIKRANNWWVVVPRRAAYWAAVAAELLGMRGAVVDRGGKPAPTTMSKVTTTEPNVSCCRHGCYSSAGQHSSMDGPLEVHFPKEKASRRRYWARQAVVEQHLWGTRRLCVDVCACSSDGLSGPMGLKAEVMYIRVLI